MSVFALLAPIVLVAAMFFAIVYARRQFRPKPRDDRDLAAHLGMGGPGAWAPRRQSPRPKSRSTHASDGAMDGGDGALDGGSGDGGGGGGDD